MTFERALGALVIAFLAWSWWGERAEASRAAREAAAWSATADSLLAEVDSRQAEADSLAAAAAAQEAAYADSLAAWAPRLARAREDAQEAARDASEASSELAQGLDSVQAATLARLRTAHEREVGAVTRRAEVAEAQVAGLEVRVSTLTAQVVTLTEQRDGALLAEAARSEAYERLVEQQRRDRWVRRGERALGALGWLCAAVCR